MSLKEQIQWTVYWFSFIGAVITIFGMLFGLSSFAISFSCDVLGITGDSSGNTVSEVAAWLQDSYFGLELFVYSMIGFFIVFLTVLVFIVLRAIQERIGRELHFIIYGEYRV